MRREPRFRPAVDALERRELMVGISLTPLTPPTVTKTALIPVVINPTTPILVTGK